MDYGYLNKNKCVLLIQKHRCGESLPAPTSSQAVSYPCRPKDKVAPARPDYSSVVKLKGIAG